MVESGDHRVLKILHIDPERNWGGGEAQVFGLIRQLADQGHQNELAAHPGGPLFNRCQTLHLCALPLVMRNDFDVRCILPLRRRIARAAYDIVHLHTKRAHALALWLPRAARRPRYVVTRRMDYPEPRTWYTDFLYNRRVDGVVAISQAILDVLLNAGVDRGKLRCIPSGVEVDNFAAIGPRATGSPAETVVGCLAGLEKRKGHRYLLEAAALLKAQGFKIRYLLGGDGPLRQSLETEARRLDLSDEVRFLGFVGDAAGFFADIDVLAVPSLYEGLGVAALEAMAAGRPVVASRVGGLRESVLEGISGCLVEPQNAAALAGALAKLAGDPSLAYAMGNQGRIRAREMFSMRNMAAGNEAFYRELLEPAA